MIKCFTSFTLSTTRSGKLRCIVIETGEFDLTARAGRARELSPQVSEALQEFRVGEPTHICIGSERQH